MDLRKNEKYEVKFAKTNRLKNSSVPYMQRILNTDNHNGNNFIELKDNLCLDGVLDLLQLEIVLPVSVLPEFIVLLGKLLEEAKVWLDFS